MATSPPTSSATTQQLLKSCLKKPQTYCDDPTQLSSPEEIVESTTRSFPPTHSWRGQKRRVGFGRLEINEHPSIMGDNPSCSDGCPLALGWNRRRHMVFDVEYYETYNPSEERRTKGRLQLSVSERSEMLLSAGYSMMEIVGQTLEVMKTKENRSDSYRNRKWDGINQAIETTTSKIRKAARRSSMLTASTAQVLLSPLSGKKSSKKKLLRLKSDDRVTLSNMQDSLKKGEGAVAA